MVGLLYSLRMRVSMPTRSTSPPSPSSPLFSVVWVEREISGLGRGTAIDGGSVASSTQVADDAVHTRR